MGRESANMPWPSLLRYFELKVPQPEVLLRKCTEVSTRPMTDTFGVISLCRAVNPELSRRQTGSFKIPRGSLISVTSLQPLSVAHFSTSGHVTIGNCADSSCAVKGLLARNLQCLQSEPVQGMASLAQMHRTGPHVKKRNKRRPLGGKPFMKGVVLKTLIKKPKKPNSANRKCVLLKLRNGKEAVAHVPGEGHNLQEHHIVLVRVGRLKDVPGVKLKVVRGKYDCAHVVKKTLAK